jgi:cytochrome c-type biogenesis protein CcmH
MMMRCFLLTLLLAFSSVSFSADNAADPVTETRLKALSTELRCLVCQNSTLADSDAPLAQDLRNEIRKLMKEGKTDEEIVDYLVARYGDFVTFRPPVNASTALLWFGPFLMLLIGAITLIVVLKKRSAVITPDEEGTNDNGTPSI